MVKLNCFILRTTTVAGLGVPIFRVFTVVGITVINSSPMGLVANVVTKTYESGFISITL